MARRIIGIDLGAYSVKLLRLETGVEQGKFDVIDAIEEVLPPENEETDLFERQRAAIFKLSQKGVLEGESFAAGLSSTDGHMRAMDVPFSEARKIEAILPGLLESDVPFDLSDMIISWHRQLNRASTNGDAGNDEGAHIRIGFGKKANIAGTLQCLQTFGIDPRQMHLNSVAPYEIVRELKLNDFFGVQAEENDPSANSLAAIIDLGHLSSSVCIFDAHGLVVSKTFLIGGKNLSERIAQKFEISFEEAQKLKHEKIDLETISEEEKEKALHEIGLDFFKRISDEFMRVAISLNTKGKGKINKVALIGGGAKTKGVEKFFGKHFENIGATLESLPSVLPKSAQNISLAGAFANALSGIHVHMKESRFNFRKDEFQWRGELDFLRAKSSPLLLWALTIVCAFAVFWFARSMVLEKEKEILSKKLAQTCQRILGERNIKPKKCIALMREQISSNIDLGIPDFTASDIYVEAAKVIPADLNVTIRELDINEKRVRWEGDVDSFEAIDRVVSSLGKIPCFTKIEKGSAQQREKDNVVRFQVSNEIDCLNKNKNAKKI